MERRPRPPRGVHDPMTELPFLRSSTASFVRALMALATIAGLAPATATAATDGAFGLTSIGTTDISIIRGETAQATGLEDIVLAPWTEGDIAPRGTATACIYTSTGTYQVSASSSNGAGGNFRLSSGTSFINYRVRWNDGVNGLTRLSNGTPAGGFVGDSTSLNCGGANPATIQVNITNAEISAAPIGTYSDTLTIMITPQ